ncbi:Central kinetochore-associated [Lasallia pustulata]|uniref:Central kinetochore-associated n=1 Tax=Lasallia pustulata TaxID=136370 RepID=A0A1W5CZ74_9LECA|nr:Central kinetochore-associated [Lasallia pustulata]
MALPLTPLSSSVQNLKASTTIERSTNLNSPKSYNTPNKSPCKDAENQTFAIAEDPPSSPLVENVDSENGPSFQVKSASRPPSPKKQSPESLDPIPLTEAALKENEGLTRAIETLEFEAANGKQDGACNDITVTNGGPQGYAGMDDTCFSAFSEVPDMTQFARMGRSPTKSIAGSPAKQMREAHYRNGLVTPGQSGRDTPGTTRKRGHDDDSRSPSPTPRGPKTSNDDDTTNLLDFTEQFNSIVPSSNPLPSRGKRNSISPIKFAPQRDVSWGSRGRITSPGKQMFPPSTPSETRSFASLLDFDIPPAPTPRSIPTVSARELESLKSTFLSQISSLRATLSGKEAEINSLKDAVGDAERRVGEAFENVREERNAKESLQHEKVDWEIRDNGRRELVLEVKEKILKIEHQRDGLLQKVDESEKKRAEAETKLAEAETRIVALRATAPSTPSGSAPGPVDPGPSKEAEAAVEKVARELHALYKTKHETKVAALKKSYEARWEKKCRDLEAKLEDAGSANAEHVPQAMVTV